MNDTLMVTVYVVLDDVRRAILHDLTPVHELRERLPSGATVYADKGYTSADDEAWINADEQSRHSKNLIG